MDVKVDTSQGTYVINMGEVNLANKKFQYGI